VWDFEQRAYGGPPPAAAPPPARHHLTRALPRSVETLFGHQEGISALAALGEHTLVSGSEDRTVRLWKVADETQLLFQNGHTASIDAVAMLSTSTFLSGSQDGALVMWSALRKRPLVTRAAAHGTSKWGGPCWVSALAAMPYSDLAISGAAHCRAPGSHAPHRSPLAI
jgi:ribosomal RNA-processing protein 9